MPIYAYQCKACGHEMEALQKISDAPLTDCPVCHEAALHKKVTAAAFRLSGSGWYETDFKNSGKKNLADKPSDKDKTDKKEKDTPATASTTKDTTTSTAPSKPAAA